MGTAAAVTDSCCNMLESALIACSPRVWVARGAAGRRVVRSHPDPSDRSCSWSHVWSSMWPFALVPALVPTTLPLRALWPRGASARGAAGWASPSKNSHAFSSCSLGWSELKTARPDKSTLWMDMSVRPRRGTGFLHTWVETREHRFFQLILSPGLSSIGIQSARTKPSTIFIRVLGCFTRCPTKERSVIHFEDCCGLPPAPRPKRAIGQRGARAACTGKRAEPRLGAPSRAACAFSRAVCCARCELGPVFVGSRPLSWRTVAGAREPRVGGLDHAHFHYLSFSLPLQLRWLVLN